MPKAYIGRIRILCPLGECSKDAARRDVVAPCVECDQASIAVLNLDGLVVSELQRSGTRVLTEAGPVGPNEAASGTTEPAGREIADDTDSGKSKKTKRATKGTETGAA